MRIEEFNKNLRLIKSGDMRGLEHIFTEYYEKMVFAAYCILHNDKDAQDAASDVILKLIRYARKQDIPRIEKANVYIYTAIRNSAFDIHNKQKPYILSNETELFEDKKAEASVVEKLDLYRAIKRLSEQDRKLVILFYFFEVRIKDISEMLSQPVGTIKWRLNEIRKKLYNLLVLK